MVSNRFFLGVILGFFVLILTLSSCGKVTQEVTVKKERPSFNLSYIVEVKDIQFDPLEVTPNGVDSGNEFNVRTGIYGSVFAYIKEGTLKEMSWGKAIIEVKQLDVKARSVSGDRKNNKSISTGDVGSNTKGLTRRDTKEATSTVRSRAFNKQGREITGSKHTWTVPSYSKSKSRWEIKSKKVLKGYPLYSVFVFDDQGHYRFKLVDQETVSGNNTLDLNAISKYDTFISIIGMKFLESDAPIELKLGDLMTLYDVQFYHLINYKFPTNLVNKFDYKRPVFQFNRPLETVLLTLYQLFIVDSVDALTYLKGLDKNFIGELAYNYLEKTIEKVNVSEEKE